MNRVIFQICSAALYLALVLYGHLNLSEALDVRAFWPGSGLLFAALYLSPYRTWLLILSGALVLEEVAHSLILQNQYWTWQTSDFFLTNELEATVAALLARRWVGPKTRLSSLKGCLRLIAASLLGASVGATLGGLKYMALPETNAYFLAWRSWWFADSLGVLATAPLVLWLWESYFQESPQKRPRFNIEVLFTLAAYLCLVVFVFRLPQGLPQPFLLYPPLIWLAARLGPLITSFAISLTIFLAVDFTTAGFGPFPQMGTPISSTTALQLFLIALSISALAIGTNLADRKRSLERRTRVMGELEESDLRYETLFDRANVPILVVGSSRIERVNPAAMTLFGKTEQELMVELSSLSAPTQTGEDVFTQHWPNAIRDGLVLPWTALGAEGQKVELELYISLVELDQGRKIQIVAHDCTETLKLQSLLEIEREKLAQDVAEATGELEQKNVKLARVDAARERFLGTISHELRTPLSAILGNCATLSEGLWGPLTPKQEDAFQSIAESGQFLGELVNDLLDIAKVESPNVIPEPSLNRVDQIAEASLRLVGALARVQGVELRSSQVSQDQVLVDSRFCKQILVNLLTNAVKFTPRGGRVDLRAELSDGTLIFEIQDSGPGVPESVRDRIFKPFTRADESVPGYGLGLALVNKLTRAMNGNVSFQSSSEGSTFQVEIPTGPPDGPPAEIGPSVSLLLSQRNSNAMEAKARYFRGRGYHVCSTESLDQVLALVKEHQPNIILMELSEDCDPTTDCIQEILACYDSTTQPTLVGLCSGRGRESQDLIVQAGACTIVPLATPPTDLERIALGHLSSTNGLRNSSL